MTLLVVDQFRMVADSYAEVTDTQGETRIERDFPKMVTTHYQVFHAGEESFASMGFCGDAATFVEFIGRLKDRPDLVTSDYLSQIADTHMREYNRCLVVIPFPNAVLSIHMGGSQDVLVEYFEGATHAFGAGYEYTQPPGGMEEMRAWFSVFYQAIENGGVPGRDVHYLEHTTSLEPREPTEETLEPARKCRTISRRIRGVKARMSRS